MKEVKLLWSRTLLTTTITSFTSMTYIKARINNIDGKKVYFHGRYILEDIFNQYDEKFKKADKLIFAGYSAGSLALGLNVDLIKRYENPYIIADSFWLDAESLNVRLGWNDGPWPKIVKFLYNDGSSNLIGQIVFLQDHYLKEII